MSIKIKKRISSDKSKGWYSLDWGRQANQRISTGVFTYQFPKNKIQKDHNKEALAILETKRSQMILDSQSINSGYIPRHKIKTNFLDFYTEYIRQNAVTRNRHLEGSFNALKKFIGKGFISPAEITEVLCERFRDYLLKNYNGETPANYFLRFKRVLRAAKKEGYFKDSPAENIVAKANKNKIIKDILSEEDYQKLMNTPCVNHEVKKAFVFSLYTGLRWADVRPLTWENVKESSIVLQQNKTGVHLEVPLHPLALNILNERHSAEGWLCNHPFQ